MTPTYIIKQKEIIAIKNGNESPIPLLGWTKQTDRVLSVLCHALGEKPTRKQLEAERLRAARLLPSFRKQFAHGLDFFPGQRIEGSALAAWLRENKVLL
jgi:hypothetical protein